jgi:hypothetical protein
MGLAAKATGRAAESRRRIFDPCPAKCVAPAFETSRARGLFWRLARAEPISLDMVNAISQEAFDAIAGACLSKASASHRPMSEASCLICLPRGVVAKLRAMRGRGESYSNVILRLAAEAAAAR